MGAETEPFSVYSISDVCLKRDACVYMYMYVYIYTYIYMYRYIHRHACGYVHTCVLSCTHLCIYKGYTHMQVHLCVKSTCTQIYIYIYMQAFQVEAQSIVVVALSGYHKTLQDLCKTILMQDLCKTGMNATRLR